MDPKEFCYWLQGFFELTGESQPLSKAQVDMVRAHLSLVFDNVTGDACKKETLGQLLKEKLGDLTKKDVPVDPNVTCDKHPQARGVSDPNEVLFGPYGRPRSGGRLC